MPALRVEDHVLRVAENQRRLFDYLNDRAPEWNWNVDLAAGTLVFSDAATGQALLKCPTFLLATKSDGDGTLLWGWANRHVSMPEAARARFERLRSDAAATGGANGGALTADSPLPLSDDTEAMAFAILAAGALDCFTFYAGGYGGGTAFLAVDRCPEVEESVHLGATEKITIIAQTIWSLPLDHRPALTAYLGEPLRTEGNFVTYALAPGGAELRVIFDEAGRMEMSAAAGLGDVTA